MSQSDETLTLAPRSVVCPECGKSAALSSEIEAGDTLACPSCGVSLLIDDLDPPAVTLASQDLDDEEEEDWDDLEDLIQDVDLTAVEESDDDDMVDDDLDRDDEEDEDDDDTMDDLERVHFMRSISRAPRPNRRPAADAPPVEEIYMTREGMERLRQELERLRDYQQPRLIAWLGEAMADGLEEEDISEVEAARSELSFLVERIRSLEATLKSAVLLVEPQDKNTVQLGALVTVHERESTQPEIYRIVSSAEADPTSGSISDRSPLGKGLLGRSVNDQVTIQSPDGPLEFRIIAIS